MKRFILFVSLAVLLVVLVNPIATSASSVAPPVERTKVSAANIFCTFTVYTPWSAWDDEAGWPKIYGAASTYAGCAGCFFPLIVYVRAELWGYCGVSWNKVAQAENNVYSPPNSTSYASCWTWSADCLCQYKTKSTHRVNYWNQYYCPKQLTSNVVWL